MSKMAISAIIDFLSYFFLEEGRQSNSYLFDEEVTFLTIDYGIKRLGDDGVFSSTLKMDKVVCSVTSLNGN